MKTFKKLVTTVCFIALIANSNAQTWTPGAPGTNILYANPTSTNVGIGITNPQTKLHVNGSIFLPVGNSYWLGSFSDSGNRLRLHHNNTEAFID